MSTLPLPHNLLCSRPGYVVGEVTLAVIYEGDI
jgi:hypothetical protein